MAVKGMGRAAAETLIPAALIIFLYYVLPFSGGGGMGMAFAVATAAVASSALTPLPGSGRRAMTNNFLQTDT